jgi:hypothetical protein
MPGLAVSDVLGCTPGMLTGSLAQLAARRPLANRQVSIYHRNK